MKILACIALLAMEMGTCAQPVYVDLLSLFDTDAVLEPGGTGQGSGLNNAGDRLDAGTLPSGYVDGTAVATTSGQASFRFAPWLSASLDSLRIDGQILDVPDGAYESLDLALLCAPGAVASPFTQVELRYADGTRENKRFGPVAGWLQSPTAFDNTYYVFADNSGVNNLVAFAADFGAAEADFLVQELGNGNASGVRFIDGHGYALYEIDGLENVSAATLGITVGNNFVISIATEFIDPDLSTTEGYEVLANSMTLYNGFEHRALGNLKQYNFDLAPYLATKTGKIYVLLTDATPQNGWGPYLQRIIVFTGQSLAFEQTLAPTADTNRAQVFAMFPTDGSAAEKPYLYDNRGSGPSNRKHRFADASGSITYHFDLPDDITDAKLTVDMANNFVVSLGGPSGVVRYAQVSPGTPEESTYLVDEGGSILGGDFRFADGSSYMVYEFDLPDNLTTARAAIDVGNQFVIEVAAGTTGEFTLEQDYVAETGDEITDNHNLDTYYVDLTPYLQNNPGKIIQIRLSDGIPGNGWGPYLTGIAIVNPPTAGGQTTFKPVLKSMDLYGEDIRNEYNKRYYTIDLSTVLITNNPTKDVFVKFTDGSTSDGWGPGVFWMAVYQGEIAIPTDHLVFNSLKNTAGEPQNYGLDLLARRYPVDRLKKLTELVLPSATSATDDQAYLLALTLNSAASDTAPRITGITRTATTAVIQFVSVSGRKYQLERAELLKATGTVWIPAGMAVNGSGGIDQATDPNADVPLAFYRLKLQP